MPGPAKISARAGGQGCPGECGRVPAGIDSNDGCRGRSRLRLAVLDFVGIEYGEGCRGRLWPVPVSIGAGPLRAAGYRRLLGSPSITNMDQPGVQCPRAADRARPARRPRGSGSAPRGSCCLTTRPLKGRRDFPGRCWPCYPGRIDLALGRAPGTDPLTAHGPAPGGWSPGPGGLSFPRQVGELLAFSPATVSPADHPYAQLVGRAAGRGNGPEAVSCLGVEPLTGPASPRSTGMSAVVRPSHEPRFSRSRRCGKYRPRVHAAARREGSRTRRCRCWPFASDDDEAVLDFEAAWTPDHPETSAGGIREPPAAGAGTPTSPASGAVSARAGTTTGRNGDGANRRLLPSGSSR